ncbi:NAD(P)H-dependent oxidoreductase [Chryseobacterium sp. BIGb0232]|uniref:NAD(P)H-dependent oxidoreductase n=1 Tax=Chryseobacterium sp. BIGb0232 TaxID=2940598 RepID=UPI000F48751B|nr:NAD(P)H-dependent oxidoreductase [Chryseobacterium sp. BIGb0232]MCS4300678.1 NAD(P)H dehydrogenase (quinone) [Chryseobacterium sp. BIGb0232]ROS20440.1 NAD(P)H dehydrogenase (quinone) [Chryseobacterium nakagawai]
MKHLIIYAHPNKASLNHLFKQTVEETLLQQKHEVVIRDLYQINFDPVLSLEDIAGQRKGIVSEAIRTEQEYIAWAEVVTFIYPIWWTGMPGIMKGYIDRVFSYGFAYRYDNGVQKGLLAGKAAYIINSHGKAKAEYQEIGMNNALKLTLDTGVYTYCGFDIKQHFFFDRADRATAEIIEVWKTAIVDAFAISKPNDKMQEEIEKEMPQSQKTIGTQ